MGREFDEGEELTVYTSGYPQCAFCGRYEGDRAHSDVKINVYKDWDEGDPDPCCYTAATPRHAKTMNWKRLSPQRERRLSEAVTTYIARRVLKEHPSGSFPSGVRVVIPNGAWQPSETEEQACCRELSEELRERYPNRLSYPFIEYPFTFLLHCQSINHIAHLHRVDVQFLHKRLWKINQELPPLPRPPLPDLSYGSDAEVIYWTTEPNYHQILKAGVISPSEWRDGLRWNVDRGGRGLVSLSGKRVQIREGGPFWFAFSYHYLIETFDTSVEIDLKAFCNVMIREVAEHTWQRLGDSLGYIRRLRVSELRAFHKLMKVIAPSVLEEVREDLPDMYHALLSSFLDWRSETEPVHQIRQTFLQRAGYFPSLRDDAAHQYLVGNNPNNYQQQRVSSYFNIQIHRPLPIDVANEHGSYVRFQARWE